MAEPTIQVHAGAHDRAGSLVRFVAPKTLTAGVAATLTADDGSLVPLQVEPDGHAVFIQNRLAKGGSMSYTLRVAEGKPAEHVALRKAGDRLELSAAGKPLFSYQMQPGEVPAGVPEIFRHGAHLHPVFSPSGRLVTGNHPPDHRWHRGIWMAWTKTEQEGRHPDFWNMGKSDGKGPDQLLAEVRFEALMKSWSGPVLGGFISTHRFIDHSGKPAKDVLNEQWEVTAGRLEAAGKMVHVIDLTSTQNCAGTEPLKLPRYHYGGLGVRGHEHWDPVEKVTMLTSNGDDRQKGDSTKGRWVHMGGEVDGQLTGMVVLIHPDNFRFPQPLRLNPKNPQLCIAPSQDGDWSIEPGKPYVSRYRILIVDGAADTAWIEAQWQDYADPVKAEFRP